MAKLHDKQEYCTQLEASLKEYKEKHLRLEQKTEELEGHHKVCIKELSFVLYPVYEISSKRGDDWVLCR